MQRRLTASPEEAEGWSLLKRSFCDKIAPSPMRKFLRILAIAVLLGLILIGGIRLNRYLADNNRFIYATGTKDKAFLNSTWKMSPHEVERANHATLTFAPPAPWDIVGGWPSVIDKTRYKELVQSNVVLWGYDVKVSYYFFDNWLHAYSVSFSVYDSDTSFEEVRKTLDSQFGKGRDAVPQGASLLHDIYWETSVQKINAWIGTKDDKDNSYMVGVRGVHRQSEKLIDDIIASEKKSYF